MKFFLIICFIVFVVPLIIRGFLRFLFGNPVQTGHSQQKRKESRTQQPPKKKKVISENEGEYVDYVEVKD